MRNNFLVSKFVMNAIKNNYFNMTTIEKLSYLINTLIRDKINQLLLSCNDIFISSSRL